MRGFTDYEKNVIKLISAANNKSAQPGYQKYNCGQFIMEQCNIVSLHLDVDDVLGEYQIITHFNDDLDYSLEKEIASIINIFKILADNYFIIVLKEDFDDWTSYRNENYERKDDEWVVDSAPSKTREYNSWSYLNADIYKYFQSYFYPTAALQEWIDSGFKTRDQLYAEAQIEKAHKQVVYSRWTLLIAIVALLVSLLATFKVF